MEQRLGLTKFEESVRTEMIGNHSFSERCKCYESNNPEKDGDTKIYQRLNDIAKKIGWDSYFDGQRLEFISPLPDQEEWEEFPHQRFADYIPPYVLAAFDKYIPGTKIEPRAVKIRGIEVELPFVVLPQNASDNPLIYQTIGRFYQLKNISF